MESTEFEPRKPPIPLGLLLPIFAWIGATSLGGGRFALYYDAFVAKRRWLSDDSFIESLTVSQVLPGPTFANLTIFLGRRLGGWWAALLSLGLILAPGAVAMVFLSHLYLLGTTQLPVVDNAFRGVGVAASSVTIATILRLIRNRGGLTQRSSYALAALAFVGLGPLQLSLYVVVPPLIILGLWLHRPRAGDRHE